MEERILNIHQDVFTVLFTYVGQMIGYAQIIASIFMAILVGSKVMSYFANPGGNFDPYVLVRPILILGALVLYEPLVDFLLIQPVDLITGVTEQGALSVTGAIDGQNFENYFESTITDIQDTSVNEDGSQGDGVYDLLQLNPGLEFLHLILFFVARVIAAYILLRQLIYKGIYLVLGIFVLPFSLIPGNGDVVKKWFFGFLAVLLWLPVLKILQTIIILISQSAGTESLFSADALLSIALQVLMVIAVLRVPSYANFMVTAGSGSGSRFTTSPFSQPGLAAYRYIRGR